MASTIIVNGTLTIIQRHVLSTRKPRRNKQPKMKNKIKQVILVIFRLDKSEVIAFFPTIPSTLNFWECTTYSHLGQHSGAGIQHYQQTKKATLEQYASLYVELKEIYNDQTIKLKVVSKWVQKYNDVRYKEIIKLIGKR